MSRSDIYRDCFGKHTNADTTTSQPVAAVLSVSPRSATRLVTIRCPICGREHTHGWPYSTDTIGARVAHCANPQRPTRRTG